MGSVATGTNMDTKPANQLERWAQNWLTYWHGNGDAHQYRYYRCQGCLTLITWHQIEAGGCECGMSRRVRPAVLSWKDKVRCLCLPWTVR